MKAAVIRHGEDKWGREPVVLIADDEPALKSKIGDFLREALRDREIAKIMKALHEPEKDDEIPEEPEDPTEEEIVEFRKSVDAKTLIDAYDEHICPNLNPWDQWHISHANDVR